MDVTHSFGSQKWMSRIVSTLRSGCHVQFRLSEMNVTHSFDSQKWMSRIVSALRNAKSHIVSSRVQFRLPKEITNSSGFYECYIENIVNSLCYNFQNIKNTCDAHDRLLLHGTHNHVFSSKICLTILGFCCSSVLSQKIKSSLEETMQKSQKNRLNPLKKHEV